MNFSKFCEYRYQELTLKSKESDEYDCTTDCEIKAVHQLLSNYRTVLKYLLMPKALFDYLLVILKLKVAPEPVLLNKIKREKEESEKKRAESTPNVLVRET